MPLAILKFLEVLGPFWLRMMLLAVLMVVHQGVMLWWFARPRRKNGGR